MNINRATQPWEPDSGVGQWGGPMFQKAPELKHTSCCTSYFYLAFQLLIMILSTSKVIMILLWMFMSSVFPLKTENSIQPWFGRHFARFSTEKFDYPITFMHCRMFGHLEYVVALVPQLATLPAHRVRDMGRLYTYLPSTM